MNDYVDDISKMALALTSGQMAKDEAVKEHGIGEDVAVHFMGWIGDSLVLICQMTDILSNKNKNDRFIACAALCASLRQYWWITAVTMLSEGYCSLDKNATQDMDLATAFIDPTKPVVECLTVMHSSISSSGTIAPVSMVTAPYRVGFGRNVMWNEILVYPEVADSYVKNAKYPSMLRKSLMAETVDGITDGSLLQMRREIKELGFLMQEFFDV